MTSIESSLPGNAPQPNLTGRSVAILNSSSDTLDLLKVWFESCGMRVHTAAVREFRLRHADIKEWLSGTRPEVVIFDIAPPYDENSAFLQRLRMDGTLVGIPIIVTTTNDRIVRKWVKNADVPIHEIVGKPYDLEALTGSVVKALTSAREHL